MIDVFEILLRTYTCNNKIGTNNNRRVGAVEGMDGTDSRRRGQEHKLPYSEDGMNVWICFNFMNGR